MKKKAIIAAAVFVIALVGVAAIFTGLSSEPEVMTMYMESDYRISQPEDLYEEADLVIIGQYQGEKETFAQEVTGRPLTIGTVKVESVLKGSVEEETVSIRFIGGEISLQEYAAQKDEETLKKMGITEARLRSREMVVMKFDTAVDAREGERYLLFLRSAPEYDYYGVMADAYGMRRLDEQDKALNPDNGLYEKISFPAE